MDERRLSNSMGEDIQINEMSGLPGKVSKALKKNSLEAMIHTLGDVCHGEMT